MFSPDELMQAGGPGPSDLVRVRGIATLSLPGRGLFLQRHIAILVLLACPLHSEAPAKPLPPVSRYFCFANWQKSLTIDKWWDPAGYDAPPEGHNPMAGRLHPYKGRHAPGHSIIPYLLMQESAKRENRDDAAPMMPNTGRFRNSTM